MNQLLVSRREDHSRTIGEAKLVGANVNVRLVLETPTSHKITTGKRLTISGVVIWYTHLAFTISGGLICVNMQSYQWRVSDEKWREMRQVEGERKLCLTTRSSNWTPIGTSRWFARPIIAGVAAGGRTHLSDLVPVCAHCRFAIAGPRTYSIDHSNKQQTEHRL